MLHVLSQIHCCTFKGNSASSAIPSAFENISAKGISPQLCFPLPEKRTMQSPASLLADCLIPSQHSCKASLFLLCPLPRSQTALFTMCAISHAKPPTPKLISIEVNLTPVRLLQTHHSCSTPLLSIIQLTWVQLKVAYYKVN